jgi:hypothetical protein
MDTMPITALARSVLPALSRRGILAGLGGGLLAARQLADGGTDSKAKKNGKRKKKRKNKRKKNDVRVDAICPGPTDNTGFGLNEGALFAQTFTTLSTGRLVLAEVLIEPLATGSADLTLQLRDVDASGVPTNNVLAEASLDVSNVPAGVSTVFFAFADPPSVAATREYALVLSQVGPRSVSWKGHFGDACAGRAFRSEPSSEPFEVPVDELDLIFTTIVSV